MIFELIHNKNLNSSGFQGEEVLHNLNHGIIVTNGSLVLQKVTRSQAGSYTCKASNVEGDKRSKPVSITIMCKFLGLELNFKRHKLDPKSSKMMFCVEVARVSTAFFCQKQRKYQNRQFREVALLKRHHFLNFL